MMMEMARTHNSMAVKRGYLIFIIFLLLMPHDRNFIRCFCLYRYRHCMVCRIDVLPHIRAFMRNWVFLSRPSARPVRCRVVARRLPNLQRRSRWYAQSYPGSPNTAVVKPSRRTPSRRARFAVIGKMNGFTDEPQCGGYPDLLDQLLLDANAAQLHCSSIDIPVQPGDEGETRHTRCYR
jgi:hypothetical protein